MRDLSLPFGTIEAEDEGEEDVPHPFVQATLPEELGRNCAAPSSFRKKKSPSRPHVEVNPHRVSTWVRLAVIPASF
jgi:hypothetical protein